MFIVNEKSINEVAAEFRQRVEELFENTDGIRDMTTESLARWVSEEFTKYLIELEEEEEDDPCNEWGGEEYEAGPPIFFED